MSVGAGDGSTSILQVDENLMSNSKLDRTNASDMFERFLCSNWVFLSLKVIISEKLRESAFWKTEQKLSK